MPSHEPEPMASAALRAGASPVAIRSSPAEWLRLLDVVLMVVAAPLALALGAPALGVLLGAGGWLVQRALAHADRRWIARAREPGSRLGLDVAEAFGRIWLLAGAIVLAGVVGHRSDGLAAALTIFAAYSVAFAVRLSSGRQGFER
ncbi:MAG: hypothetical protein ACRDLF_11320 [Solirubrobacteraceae bacterium]